MTSFMFMVSALSLIDEGYDIMKDLDLNGFWLQKVTAGNFIDVLYVTSTSTVFGYV